MTTQRGRVILNWRPTTNLQRYFTPTNESLSTERSKARFKNKNLPFLQYLYHGDELEPLKCLISGSPGWVDFNCLLTDTPKQRFNIDFNHIRQKQNGTRVAGTSKDKLKQDPSDLFRRYDIRSKLMVAMEFMCIMPVSQEYHNYITQDSALGDITLQNFEPKYWPWFLQSDANFNELTTNAHIKVNGLSRNWMIEHLSDITRPSIHQRINHTIP